MRSIKFFIVCGIGLILSSFDFDGVKGNGNNISSAREAIKQAFSGITYENSISLGVLNPKIEKRIEGKDEDDDKFDPTLPNEPPPPEINIVKEEYSIKGVSISLDDFDIDDVSKIKYLDLVIKNAAEQNFDVELTLAVIKKESNFNPWVRSSVGAIGLMQILPETARWLGLKNISRLLDPDTNIKYGIKYLRYLFCRFAPDINVSELGIEDASKEGFLKVLAAYNAGPGNVEKYDKPPYNGIPPFKETQKYVKKVSDYFIKFENLRIKK